MATDKQIQANRRNAQKSTGPRSAEGKAVSSRNALKTGLFARGIIIGHESSVQLEDLEARFTAEYRPSTPTERALVDTLIHLEWMLRRYRWLETETWHATQDQLTSAQMESTWTGHAFILQPAISRLHRMRNSTQKAFRETLAELRSLQAENGSAVLYEPPPEPDVEPIETTPPTVEIGFVPSNCDSADPGEKQPPAHEKHSRETCESDGDPAVYSTEPRGT
jgi:hypothetical protein